MGRRSLALTRDIGLDGDDVAPARHRYVSGCAIRSPSELTSVPAGKHTSESGLPASVWTALQPHKGPSETTDSDCDINAGVASTPQGSV